MLSLGEFYSYLGVVSIDRFLGALIKSGLLLK